MKRCFDLTFSLLLLISLGWLIFITWLIASINTKSNGFFIQERVGKGGVLFPLIKIRTMNKSNEVLTNVTTSDDKRVTFWGKIFRKTKIDELPQLLNILVGHMSFVGPRPDVPGYADCLGSEDQILISVRPGITGPASIKYRNEESLLAQVDDPERYNDEVIWPDKVKINKEYIKNYNLYKDFEYLYKTLLGVFS